MSEIFYYRTQVRERHLDSFGHMNNACYLELYEEAPLELYHGQRPWVR